jgi:hypothetical protein
VNLPWLAYGCDFGANAWQPGGGLAQPERRRRLEDLFVRLAASDLRTVRWFVLCDGRSGVEFDEDGVPRGLDGFFERDFEAALEAASRHRLSLIPVLFDFLWCGRRRVVNGVALGGRMALLARAARRRALFGEVVSPLLRQYGNESVISAWDLFNEPEWATLGYGSLNPVVAMRPGTMRGVLRELAALARAEARQEITVGLASPRGLRLLRDVEIDRLQVHWYDRRSAELYALEKVDKPVLLGEFPTRGSGTPPGAILRAAQACGYGGALAWSAAGEDAHSDLGALEQAMRANAS